MSWALRRLSTSGSDDEAVVAAPAPAPVPPPPVPPPPVPEVIAGRGISVGGATWSGIQVVYVSLEPIRHLLWINHMVFSSEIL